MTRYSLFLGCQIPSRLPQYETAARAVLEKMGIDLEEIRQFNCCGYPMRNADKKAFLLSSVRNMALSEKAGLDMLVLCNCCYGALKNAENIMKQNGPLQDEIIKHLKKTGLNYQGNVKVNHYLSVLYDQVGIKDLKKKLLQTYKDLNVAVQYGCHLLRPSKIIEFDEPVNPSRFDQLVETTGAKSVEWTNKLECCGAPLTGINDELSADLCSKKINEALKAEAMFFCTSCPYCQIQFDTVQDMMVRKNPDLQQLPSVLFPQLLGLCMGIDSKRLGLKANIMDITKLEYYLSKE